MIWKKDKVTLYTGEEKEVEIHYISGRQRDLLIDEFIKAKFKTNKTEKEGEMDFKPYTLRAKIMSDFVKGANIDEINTDDYDRIFETYFQKLFSGIFGSGDDTKN